MTDSLKTIDQVISEFVEATERREPVDKAEFLNRYPQFRVELVDFFESHEQLSATCETLALGQKTLDIARRSGTRPLAQTAFGNISSVSNPPRFLGDYELLEEIDRGGMGVVYKAIDQKLNRTVALKLIRSGELASDEEVQRFMSEAEAAAALTHPGIVPIYEVGSLNGLVFYTMAFIEGKNLAALVEEGAIDPTEAVRITHKLCAAVEFAHRAGVYHRDLKPANVLINRDGQPIIIDFGLAKIARNDQSLTATGQILGTPAYMTPEHASGKAQEIGPAADTYALGAILYFLCAGQPAFSGSTPFDVLIQVLDRRPTRPSKLNKLVSSSIDSVCLRMLEKDPDLRYPTVKSFANDLQRILTSEPIESPQENLPQLIRNWWQREPILAAHMMGIGVTTLIVSVAYILRDETSTDFYYRLGLLSAWLGASLVLQYWVVRAAWRHVAIVSWLMVDALIYTTLIAFAQPPRSMLLIGYPMMVVASGLYYQRRFTILMTGLCIVGLAVLGWQFPQDDFMRPDFCAIFICGLIVICLCLVAVINRVRGLCRFCEE